VTSPGDLPYRFEPTATAAQLHERFDSLDAGAETDETVTVAGRLMLRRVQGKLAFGQLQDSTGRVQLFCPAQVTERFDEFADLDLGDWIGATGEMMKTRKGELSVKVREWVLLAKARRQFPDKWHGLSDVDARYRQRYVDLWVTEEARRAFEVRSSTLRALRRALEDRGFVEVETPVLQPVPGGATARPFVSHHNALDMELYLRIAIELHLKRLVVAGLEKVFEIGRVFRNEGIGPRWNPEFTMLELYQAYADYEDMMRLTEEVFSEVTAEVCGTTKLSYGDRPLDLSTPWRRASMTELVAEHAGVDVDVAMPVDELRTIAKGLDVHVEDEWGPGKIVLEIYEKTTEGELWGPVFVTDYPQEVSPLAREHRSKPGYVERFEAIIAGRELANAFSELTDPDEQRARFEEQARLKAAGDEEAMVVDEDYLRALEYGLPPTGGLGVGIDRFVMLLADAHNIRDVILFPTLRPEQPS
jgi:lysyl-tRNA synthetase class 2